MQSIDSVRSKIVARRFAHVVLLVSVFGQLCLTPQTIQARSTDTVAAQETSPTPMLVAAPQLPPLISPLPISEPTPAATDSSQGQKTEPASDQSQDALLPTSVALPTATEPVTDTPPLDETQLVQKGKDTKLSNGRISVSLPDAVDLKSIRVQIKSFKHMKDGEKGNAFVFDISAKDQNNVDIHKFAVPVTLTLKSKDLLANADPKVYYYDDVARTWWRVPIAERNDKNGTITIVTNHFSTWCGACSGGADEFSVSESQPQVWKLTPNFGDVSLFRGSSSYAYPIDVPSVPNGLHPNVTLQYSSAAADEGMQDRPNLGHGWSMDVPKITRRVQSVGISTGTAIYYANDFKISMDGHDYNLVRKGSNYQEYVAENYAPIRVYRCNAKTSYCGDGTDAELAPGLGWGLYDSREYWKVWTADGTLYVFGADITSTQSAGGAYDLYYQPLSSNSPITEILTSSENNVDEYYAGAAAANGTTEHYIASAWYLRWVYSPVQGSYDIKHPTATSNRWSMRYNYGAAIGANYPRYEMRLGSIDYGNRINPNDGSIIDSQYQVKFDYELDNSISNNPSGVNTFTKLVTVTVKANNVEQRHYVLTYNTGVTSVADRKLLTINQYGGITSTQALPTISFTYTNPSGYIYHLQTVDNGYGGLTKFDYTTTGATPIAYQVITKTMINGLTGATALTQTTVYTYAGGCRDHDGQLCRNTNNHDFGQSDRLLGISTVTEKSLDANSNVIAQTEHLFHTEFKLMGMEKQTRSGSVSGITFTVMSAQQMEYVALDNAAPFNNTFPSWAWLTAQKVITSYPNGDIGSTPAATTTLVYGDAYGNWTDVYEYGFTTASGDERSTHRVFINNPGTGNDPWIIGKPSWERLYEGANTPDISVYTGSQSLLRAQVVYFYDGATAISYTAPTQGLLTQVNRGDGASITQQYAQYDAVGNLSVITDANGNVSHAFYDNTGLFLTESRTPAVAAASNGLTNTYFYYGINDNGCVTSGGTGLYGQLKCVHNPNYNELGSSNNTEVAYSYDYFGRLKYIVKPGDGSDFSTPTEEYQYYDGGDSDTTNVPKTTTWPLQIQHFVRKGPGTWCGGGITNWTRSYYDGLGRLVQQQSPGEGWACGGTGQDIIQNTRYDTLGRTVEQSVPYTVTANANFSATSAYVTPDWSKPTLKTGYDALGRTIAITAADGVVVTQTYGLDNVSTQGYSPTNALMVQSSVDGNGHAKSNVTDGLGRVVLVREFRESCFSPGTCYSDFKATGETRYGYNALDSLTRVTDTVGNSTVITYDILGRKVGMWDPDMGPWSYAYDSNGNLTQQTDARGKVLYFTYDSLNRLTEKRYNSPTTTPLEKYGYDLSYIGTPFTASVPNSLGRRTWMTTTNGTDITEFFYDVRGRPSQVVKNVGPLSGSSGALSVTYGYDSADRVLTSTLPNSEIVTQTYSSRGLPLDLRSSTLGKTYIYSATYNALGQPVYRFAGNGLRTSYGYFGIDSYPVSQWGLRSFGRLFQTCVISSSDYTCPNDGSSNALFNMSYWYDNVGNILNVRDRTNANQVLTFTYDELDRLTRAYRSSGQTSGGSPLDSGRYDQTYGYNAIGNILTKTDAISTVTSLFGAPGIYTYSATSPSGRPLPHAVRYAGSNYAYEYDENGNVITRTENGTVYTHTFSSDNRLTTINQSGKTTGFIYDADGKRVAKLEPGSVSSTNMTYYLGDQFEVQVPGFTTNPVIDDFNRVSTLASPPWYGATTFYSVTGSQLQANNNASWIIYDVTYGTTQEAFIKLSSVPVTTTEVGVVLKAQTNNNINLGAMRVTYAPGSGVVRVYTKNNGASSWVQRGSNISASFANGDFIGARTFATGTVEVYKNTSLLANIDVSASTIYTLSGRLGIYLTSGVGSLLDDFTGGTVLTATSSYCQDHNWPKSCITRSYYGFGGQNIAVREQSNVTNTLNWLYGDHLGSASLTTDDNGAIRNNQRYLPFGEVRWSTGGALPTDLTFTSQRADAGIGSAMDFDARFYSPIIGRFLSPDTIVPGVGNPQAFNRYSYSFNSPLVLRDPTGHDPRDNQGRSMNDDCNYAGRGCQRSSTPIQQTRSNSKLQNQSQCDYLGSAGTLCMQHLLNAKPSTGLNIIAGPTLLVTAKTEDESEEGENGGGGGGGSDQSKEKKSFLQRLLSSITDPAKKRVTLRSSTKAQIQSAADKTPDGKYFIDPNTKEKIPVEGPFDYGHRKGFEWRRTQETARTEGWTRKQVIEYENDPTHYQIEDPSSNRSHRFEEL